MKPNLSQNGYVLYLSLTLLVVILAYVGVILSSQRVDTIESKFLLNKLQASVLAYSGLNLAEAYTSGYEGHEPASEIQEMVWTHPNGGVIELSQHYDAGWILVRSEAVYLNDTSVVEGILGKSPPSFSWNAVTLGSSGGDVVVADRATVTGDIATTGGKVQIRNGGVFKGNRIVVKAAQLDDNVMETELSDAQSAFRKMKGHNDTSLLSASDSIINSASGPDSLQPIVFGSETLTSPMSDFAGKSCYYRTNLVIWKSAVVRNLRCFVEGNVTITDSACLEFCSISALGSVIINGNSRVRGNIVCAESLVVGGSSRIVYPSFLYLSALKANIGGSQDIVIQDNAAVTGTIATGDFHDNSSTPRIVLQSRGGVQGCIICPGAVMPYGQVSGSLYAGAIIYRQERTVYQNWFRDVSVAHKDVSMMTIPFLTKTDGDLSYLTLNWKSGSPL